MEHTVEHNGETHQVPDHMITLSGGDVETAKSNFVKGLETIAGAQATPEPQNEPIDNTPALKTDESPAPAASNEPPATPAPTEWWKDYGFTSKEDVDAQFEKIKTLSEKEQEIARKAGFWDKIENPFAEQDDYKISQFKKETGLKGRSGNILATDILISDIEDLKANPSKAMAIARAIEDTKILKDYDLNYIQSRIEREAEAKGVDFTDKESTQYKDFEFDSRLAIRKIEEYREKFGNFNNVFESLQNAKTEFEKTISDRAGLIKHEVSNLVPKNFTKVVEGTEYILEAPTSILNLVDDNFIRNAAANHDVRTPEGKQALKDEIKDFVEFNMVKSGEYDKQMYSKMYAALNEKFAQSKFNGKERVLDRGGSSGSSAKISEVGKQIQEGWGISS